MYDLDEIIDRRTLDSSKWDCKENEISLSIADMDFKTCPKIIEELRKRVDIGIFGYTNINERFKTSIINWWKSNHNYEIKSDEILFSCGVIPTISACINRLTNIGDNVVLLTPVYNIFFNCILNHGRHPLESKLVYENEYFIDFLDLEEKLSNPLTSMLILCNPHNPIGKIWKREELEKINELCIKYNVLVISDEIHCDLTEIGKNYVPFNSINSDAKNNSIICLSASKAFNLAGLQGSIIVVCNQRIRNIVNRAINSYEVAEPNSFTVYATTVAFESGMEWLNEVKEYISNNKKLVIDFFKHELPMLKILKSEATYLLWIDCSSICNNTDLLVEEIRNKTGLILSKGSSYRGNGDKFFRMNIATNKKTIVEALNRLKKGINYYIKKGD